MTRRIAILGASGYAGREVARLVAGHPELHTEFAMSARPGVTPAEPELPHDPAILPLDLDRLSQVEGVFVCAPHGAAAGLVHAALEAGTKVVDLSADFRLTDPAVYAKTYGLEHPHPELLPEAVYGLTEHARDDVSNARLVANPGCYPTSISLPLVPLLQAGLIDIDGGIVADCKSGTSGAGASPQARTHFGNVHDNFLAYGVGDHRHTPEIHAHCGTSNIIFVPHLLPVFRGILATLYVRPQEGVTCADVLACLDEAYAAEPFVRLYARGLPELDRVARTNFCDIAARSAGDRIVLVAAIDNLVKGAAGQAVQNMNLMLGLAEEAGLR